MAYAMAVSNAATNGTSWSTSETAWAAADATAETSSTNDEGVPAVAQAVSTATDAVS